MGCLRFFSTGWGCELIPALAASGLAQRFGGQVVFSGVSFEVLPGEVFAILGGSGSGKSTLMKQLIGLLPPSQGDVKLFGQRVSGTEETPGRIGVMFQSGALFGSMTLLENVLLPLEIFSGLPADAREAVARVKLGLVGLADAAARRPAECSGGMVKRAAIARALALDPAILFLDEPSAGLDPTTAAGLDRLILDLRRDLGATFVLVTHELDSILAIADRCIMLASGVNGVIAEGDPRLLREQATDPVVRAFFRREML
jgi:phospholipid/cholesterol/gamma-HCH transport system ATP-binding protein